ncbi:hypothetical protein BD413DRAFT_153688 [Trametes elegans]|nr:hypothetical protein BD413DRAFT_153688 [Trametes elegans]
METCPSEIWMLIFSFACTDDGSTGRSLSLVSRAFQHLSYPYQWQSLAIYGHAQAAAFTKQLFSRPPSGNRRRPIEHLFVSTRHPSIAFDNATLAFLPTWPGILRSVLRYAAPTLRTLAVVSFEAPMASAVILSQALRVHYPFLVELTIRCRCTPQQLLQATSISVQPNDSDITDVSVEAQYGTWTPIPTLRRLHVACALQGLVRGTQAEHALVTELAPSLTHFRLSVLDLWGSKRLAEILHAECAVLGIADPVLEIWPSAIPPHSLSSSAANGTSTAPSSHRHPFPQLQRLSFPGNRSSAVPPPAVALHKATRVTWDGVLPSSGALELFALQPPPTELSGAYCSCCMDMRGDGNVMRVFEALARGSDERFLYIPCRTRMVYGFEEARDDWLERIDGLCGCWAARQDEDEGPSGGRTAVDATLEEEEEESFDRPAGRKRGRAAAEVLKTAVKWLQKAKFW